MLITPAQWTLNQTTHTNQTFNNEGTVLINANFFWNTLAYIPAACDRTKTHMMMVRRDTSQHNYGGGWGLKSSTGDSGFEGLSHCMNIVTSGSWGFYESGSSVHTTGLSNGMIAMVVDTNGVVTLWDGSGGEPHVVTYTSSVPAPNPFYWVVGGGAYWNDPTDTAVDTSQFAQFEQMYQIIADGGGGGLPALERGQDFPPSRLI